MIFWCSEKPFRFRRDILYETNYTLLERMILLVGSDRTAKINRSDPFSIQVILAVENISGGNCNKIVINIESNFNIILKSHRKDYVVPRKHLSNNVLSYYTYSKKYRKISTSPSFILRNYTKYRIINRIIFVRNTIQI